jgi:hypothetical protein
MDTAVKFVKGSDTLIEGLAIPFGGPDYLGNKDFDGEAFGPDTDFALDWFPTGRPIIYHHGVHDAMKTAVQGRQLTSELTDEGVFARGELDKSAKYHATVSKLIAQGKLFFSSGAVPHLVETTEDGAIKRWPWVELSLTPTPANPLAAVHHVKSADIVQRLQEAELPVPADLIAAALKALDGIPSDTDTAPVPEPFIAHAVRVSDDVAGFVAHAREYADMRAKAGRVLSEANWQRLAGFLAAIEESSTEVRKLLAETDPKATEKAATAELAGAAFRFRLNHELPKGN